MNLRLAKESDVPLLAAFNQQLIEDEKSSNPMDLLELENRMRKWLLADYEAAVFEVNGTSVGYALIRPAEPGWYIRQFFIIRGSRRSGVGTKAFQLLRETVIPVGDPIFLEVFLHNVVGRAFWSALGFEQNALSLRLGPSVDAAK